MKKKALVLAVYMACVTPDLGATKPLSSSFNGLNLGEVQSHSNLGEPFNGVIPILHTSVKEAKTLKVRLAPKSIFTKLGAEKAPELNYLNFSIKSHNNKPVIVISSSRPISTPILNFILEIESPKGVIYQDYTVMLDPAPSSTQATQKVSKEKASGRVKKTKSKAKKSPVQSNAYKNSTLKYKVKSGDTLSIIAKRYKPKKTSLKSMMNKIHHANPKAFIRNNPNKIIKGAILRIPSAKKTKRQDTIKPLHKVSKRVKNTKQTGHGSNYIVKRGDSLSKITKKFVYKGVSFTKMMKAIYKANPSAFSKNKMNLLIAGAHLKIPSYADVINKNPTQVKRINDVKKQQVKKPEPTQVRPQDKPADTITKERETPQSTISNNPSKDIINALKDSNVAISKLQKRIRELRGKLLASDEKYQELTKILSNNNFLIALEENNNISDFPAFIKDFKNKTAQNPPLALAAMENNANSIAKETPIQGTEKSPDKSISRNTFSSIIDNLDPYYVMLALLLGLGLIRYRDRIYSYTSINYDQPNYYPPADQEIINVKESEDGYSVLDKKPIILQEEDDDEVIEKEQAQISTPSKTHEQKINIPEIKQAPIPIVTNNISPSSKPDESGIDEKSFHECELLIDELIKELSKKSAAKSDSLDDDIDKILESDLDVIFETQYLKEKLSENPTNKKDPQNNKKKPANPNVMDILNDVDKVPPISETAREHQLKQFFDQNEIITGEIAENNKGNSSN